MKPSKNIERLFQEGLNDLYASPSKNSWDEIEKRLSKKQNNKKRLIGIWWRKAASIAAILAVFASIGVFYNSTFSGNSSSIVLKDDFKSKSDSNVMEILPARFGFSSVNRQLSITEEKFNNRIAFQVTKLNSTTESATYTNKNYASNQRLTSSVSRLTVTDITLNKGMPLKFSLANLGQGLETADGEVKKKSLLDVLKAEETISEGKSPVVSQWEINPNVAPVFMSSLNGGNPLESNLNGKTSSNPNVSFGINVAYAINKKLKIRTGVNQLAVGYNTQDVVISTTSSSFSSSISSSNIKTNLTSSVQFMNVPAIQNRSLSTSTNPGFIEAQNFSSVGVLNHELGFLEVPLEVEYAIIDKKIGLHVLGGASTYLLNNNEIFFEENGLSSRIGEAQNLNSLSFSANLGFGMDYNFSKTLSFNLEPKFLYQINTFQANNSDFQPYFFGIYSGLKIKF
jgi:hypothetical protein